MIGGLPMARRIGGKTLLAELLDRCVLVGEEALITS